jgi:predicted LPLAT superfamily acyltransferase
VFYYAVRERGMKYRFMFTEVTEKLGNADQLLDIYIKSLEETVKAYPRQWFNFYNYWND